MLDISRGELARLAGVAERTISDFETGRRQPIPATVAAIQRALEASGVEFTDGDAPGVMLKNIGGNRRGILGA